MSTTSYLVTWEIEVDADSAEQAVTRARRIQLDPHSLATTFLATPACVECKKYHTQQQVEIDLIEGSRDN